MKRCPKCGADKAPTEFYRNRSRADGLSIRCKACITVEREVYRKANRAALRDRAASDRAREPERGGWQRMVSRCTNPSDPGWHNYGGRGVMVCARWRDSFEAFLADMGPKPSPRHTLDRIDVNGNYEPGNCRWATPKEQARNTRVNRLVAAFGRTQCLAAWAEEKGLPVGLVGDRLDQLGWDAERALSAPIAARGSRRRAA